MSLADEIDLVVAEAIRGMTGMKSNAEIRERVLKLWPERLARFDPSPTRIGKSLRRLGYDPWRDRKTRGFDLGAA